VLTAATYVMNCNVSVPRGVTLTLDPGTVLKFGANGGITVSGILDAVGLSTAPITLTSINDSTIGGATGSGKPTAGDWVGLTGLNSLNIEYSHIKYATQAVSCVGPSGRFVIAHDQLDSIKNAAIGCDGATNPRIDDNQVIDAGTSSSPAIYVYNGTVTPGLIGGNSASGGYAYFTLDDDNIISGTLPTGGPGWIFQRGSTVPSGDKLILPPGSILKFGSAGQLNTYGTLMAVGSSTAPIVFTSINDPVGGATGTGHPIAGDWTGLLAQSSGLVDLQYSRVEYANEGVNCNGDSGPDLIKNNIFKSIKNSAIDGSSSVPLTVENNQSVDAGSSVSRPSYLIDGGALNPSLIRGNTAIGLYPFFAMTSLNFTTGTLPTGGPTWIVDGGVAVPSGVTLTLGPGTVLKFGLSGHITVSGVLNAVGRSSNPITLTSVNDSTIGGATGTGPPAAGDWQGIVNLNSVNLEFAHLSYASRAVSSAGGTGSFVVVHNQFRSIKNNAVYCEYATNLTIEDNQAIDAGTSHNPAFYVYSSSVAPDLIGRNSAIGGYPYFTLDNDSLLSGTLPTGGPTWLLQRGATVPIGDKLVLPPDSLLKFGFSAQLSVQGTLVAIGSKSKPIVFTSINDAVGGTTGTGQPKEGDWTGISLGSAQLKTHFGFVVFKYAATAVNVSVLDALSIINSVFSYNGAAIAVQTTVDSDPALAALPCNWPYLSVVSAATDYFGQSGYPSWSLDLPTPDIGELGNISLAAFTDLFGDIQEYGVLETPPTSKNTVPWSLATCKDLTGGKDVGIPVTAVIPPLRPRYRQSA
jgi:hypothetical protein